MFWAKYIVICHKCELKRDYKGDLEPFYCSSLETARAFSNYWGGFIKKA